MLDLGGVVFALLLVSLISIILNSFCIHVVRTKQSFQEKPSAVLLTNLLFTHLFQGLIVIPMNVGRSFDIENLFWARFFKNGFHFTYTLSFYGICFGVLIISVDRFLATYLLTKYKAYVTFRNAKYILITTWMYTCVLCVIPFIPKASTEDNTEVFGTSMSNDLHSFNETEKPTSTSNMSTLIKGMPRLYFYIPQDEWIV